MSTPYDILHSLKVDAIRAHLARVADAYGHLTHTPNAPDVSRAYDTLRSELWTQFNELTRTLRVRFVADDPYPTYAAMRADVTNGRLDVYNVAVLPDAHPLAVLAPNGQTYNTIFRAVHDGSVHAPNGYGFGMLGEFRAFQAHCRLLSPLAQMALATETMGQNAYFHFGPHKDVPASRRPFAPQIAGILPLSLIRKGMML